VQTKISLLQPGVFKLDIDMDSDIRLFDNAITAVCQNLHTTHQHMPIDTLSVTMAAPGRWPFSIALKDGRTWAQDIVIVANDEPLLQFYVTDAFKLSEIQTHILPLREAVLQLIQLNKLTKLTAKWIS